MLYSILFLTPRLGEYIVKSQGIKSSPFGFDNVVKWTKATFGSYGVDYNDWRNKATDTARGKNNQTYLYDTAVDILSFYDTSITIVDEAITAFDQFGSKYLINQYLASHPQGKEFHQGIMDDNHKIVDAAMAYDVAQDSHIQSFDGSTATDRAYDCGDFAALISGLAHSLGLISRMISVTMEYDVGAGRTGVYNHVFTELYGKNQPTGAPVNDGWWIVDPGHGGLNYIIVPIALLRSRPVFIS